MYSIVSPSSLVLRLLPCNNPKRAWGQGCVYLLFNLFPFCVHLIGHLLEEGVGLRCARRESYNCQCENLLKAGNLSLDSVDFVAQGGLLL